MIYLKENPVGIDVEIQRIQQALYNKATDNYSCDVVAFGRVYKDIEEGVTKPLFYFEDGEYKYVLIDDNINGLHFFFVENDSTVESRSCFSNANIDIIVLVDDLTKVKPSLSHYGDEEVKEDVKNWVNHEGIEITSVVKGADALKGFDIEGQKFRHPFYVFKLTGNINYY